MLLITVDTLRPDALGFGGGTNATPVINRLARGGFAFPKAVAPVPLTLPSHAAILTGMLPRRLGLRDNGQLLEGGPPTLAERLGARGYSTAAFVSGYPLDSAFGLDRGFGLYDDRFTRGPEGDLERPAPATAAAAWSWLRAAPAPWFAWVHFYDPHYPYEPPPEHRRPGPRGAYDGEVAAVDQALGTLLAGLEGQPVLTAFAADHGESLGEHGEGTHGFFIYDSTVLVPLVFRYPGRITPGTSTFPARLVDVVPTVLSLLGLGPPSGLDGVDLGPVLAGRRVPPEPAYLETYQPWLSYGWAPLRAVRHRGFKLIDAPRPELYALDSDPREERNVLAEHKDAASGLRRLLAVVEAQPIAGTSGIVDPDALARLRALGYVGTSGPASEPPRAGLRDPKDGAELRELLTQADQLLRRGDARAALSRFDRVLARDPDNRFALQRSATALLEDGRVEGAIARLEKAVRLDAQQADLQGALAAALDRAGRHALAARHWAEAAKLQPRTPGLWASLGSSLGASGKEKEAAVALARAVELAPGDAGLLARLAFAEHGAGDVESAIRHLRQSAEASPAGAFLHSGALGLLLVRAGRRDEARPWLAASRRSEPEFGEARLELALLEISAGREGEARRALGEALEAQPTLRVRAEGDPRLGRLLP